MTFKPKPCPQCGIKFRPDRPLQTTCSPKCAIEFNKPKNVNARVKEFRKDKSINELRSIARSYFQEWIRLRDEKQPCISCDTTAGKWDGGHFMKAEIYTGLIFDEDNCHKQCAYCNLHLEGNTIEYEPRLVKRIGEERVKILKDKKDASRVYKFSREELTGIAEKYRELIKQIKKAA